MTTTTSSISRRHFAQSLPPTVSAKAVEGGLLHLISSHPNLLENPAYQEQLRAFCRENGLQEIAKRNPLGVSDLQEIITKLADAKGDIDPKKLFSLLDTLDADGAKHTFSTDGGAGRFHAILTGTNLKELEKDARQAMFRGGKTSYRKAKSPLKELEANEAFIKLGSSTQGKAIQDLLRVAASQGKDVLPLLKESDPKRMMQQAWLAVQSTSYQPGSSQAYESKLARIQECLKKLQAVKDPSQITKSGAVIGLTNALKEDPALFHMLDPKSQKIVGALLLERLGQAPPLSTESQAIKAALASLKKDNPEFYRSFFSGVKKAMGDPKLWKQFTQTLYEDGRVGGSCTLLSTAWAARIEKFTRLMKSCTGAEKAGLLGGVSVAIDTALFLSNGKGASTVSADILNSFLSFGMGAAVSVGTSALTGGAIGLVPTFLLATWKSAVDAEMTKRANQQTHRLLEDPAVSVEEASTQGRQSEKASPTPMAF